MILAAISFSDPVMLAGLAAAGIPVMLHLLNRIRSPIVMFPTLRFLKITAQKTSRRRQVQQYLLLLIRMAVFAMIAMAIARPLIRGGSATLAYGFVLMLLAGLGLLVLAGVWGAEAWGRKDERRKTKDEIGKPESESRNPKSEIRGSQHAHQGPKARYWGLAGGSGVAAILLMGYAVFGLGSDRYFSGDKGEFTGRSTAVVIVLDNSHSMLAREDSGSRLMRAKEQVREILSETVHWAEAAIVVTNPGETVAEDRLTSDTTRLLGYLDKLQPVGKARPMKERIHKALEVLQGSTQASRMLIVVSDFAKEAFEDAEVFGAIKEMAGAKNVQVVLMPIGKGSSPADVGIAAFSVADGSGPPVVGSEMTFQAEVVNNGDAAEVKELAFSVDDGAAEPIRLRVQLGPAGTGAARATVKVPYRLTQAGAHRFTLKLVNVSDAMTWDDQRELVLQVADQVRVLVIGAEPKMRARSAAFYFMAALAPFEGTRNGETAKGRNGEGVAPPPWSIKPTYRGVDEVKDYGSVAGYAAVFVCDVPRIAPGLADGLGQYVKHGGRVAWVLGASVDGAEYNQVLLANGRDLLPGALGQPVVSAGGSTIDWVDVRSPVFGNLFDNQEPFREVVVTGRWGLAGGGAGRVLGKLADGGVILVEQPGMGESGSVYTLLTSPSAAWSNLGATVLLVPMASRMALGDAGQFRGETSYEPGATLLIHVPGADRGMAGVALDVTTPTGAVVNARAVMSGDVPRWYFDKTLAEGVYHWRASDGKHAGMFVVNPPGEEVDLQAGDVEGLAREVGANRSALVTQSAGDLLGQLQKRSEGTTLAPGVLAMVLMLAVLEGLMANRRVGGLTMARKAEGEGERLAA